MQVLRDKEIKSKIPTFSLISTIQVVSKTIGMKAFVPDTKRDDVYICATDGEEIAPPRCDNIGRSRQLNNPAVLTKLASKKADKAIIELHSSFSPLGTHKFQNGRTSTFSARSGGSRASQSRLSHDGKNKQG